MTFFEKNKDLILNSKYAGMIFHLRENQNLGTRILNQKWGIKPNSLGALAHTTGLVDEIKDAFGLIFEKLKRRGVYDRYSKDQVFEIMFVFPIRFVQVLYQMMQR